MNNSRRFIDAYNRIDKALHNRFGFKPSMSYSDAVRRAAAINSVVRKYEDDLIDYGRLRNAIVHRSNSKATIAEPHDDVTERFEHIAEILEKPPLASTIAHKATTVKKTAPLVDAIRTMDGRGFSNMPVIDGGRIVGILTNKTVVAFLAAHMGDMDAACAAATVGDALDGSDSYYAILRDCPVDDVLAAYEKNRRLVMLMITRGGKADGELIGVVTPSDLVTVSKMLAPY